MSKNRVSLIALALAPLLAIAACDQVSSVLERARGAAESGGGPAPLESVAVEARAIAGEVLPDGEIQSLLATEPVMATPGEIIVGARVESQLVASAAALGISGNFVNRLRADGMDAFEELPDDLVARVRAAAEERAGTAARNTARTVIGRLGLQADAVEVDVNPGGVVVIDLRPQPGPSPTALNPGAAAAPEAATPAPAADATPEQMVWTDEACPRIVNARDLEANLELATRCAVQRLSASRQFEFVEPNFIIDVQLDRLFPPRQEQAPAPRPPESKTLPPEPNAPAAAGLSLPNDPLAAFQWHYRPRGTAAGQSPGGAGFETFWTRARQVGSRNVRVAVLDTGLLSDHPDIAQSGNVGPGVDLITAYERAGDDDGIDTNPYDVGDRCGAARENSYHGTHVAGTIGAVATNDRIGVAGGAWEVTILPVRVLGRCGGELADIVSGIRWAAGLAPAIAENGAQFVNSTPADVINMSLSVGIPCPASMQAAIDAAVARGSVIVVAAGNKARPTQSYAPANCNNVIVVGANDARGGLAFYSNFGAEVDILAPGGDIFTDSDADGRPDGVLSSRVSSEACTDPATNASAPTCYYGFLQGTSMATPHVSAALALLAAQTGLRGRLLEDALFTRALGPIDPAQCRIECARNQFATPVEGQAGQCMRACGRGMLDLARAASAPVSAPVTPAGGMRRRR
ncbi:MAG: S8 family serine peptidase [Alphaproteobacteria bacterium]|nr:S8 family serine peptidase [Alphaproteobacteria bacterium]